MDAVSNPLVLIMAESTCGLPLACLNLSVEMFDDHSKVYKSYKSKTPDRHTDRYTNACAVLQYV